MEGLGLALRGSFIKVKGMASMCLACSRVLITYFKQNSSFGFNLFMVSFIL